MSGDGVSNLLDLMFLSFPIVLKWKNVLQLLTKSLKLFKSLQKKQIGRVEHKMFGKNCFYKGQSITPRNCFRSYFIEWLAPTLLCIKENIWDYSRSYEFHCFQNI